jgi:hypothetical protein
MAGFQISDAMYVGYSYDFETTRLNNYNSGSHEIFLLRIIKNNDKITTNDSSKAIIMKKNTLHNYYKCFH